MSFPSRSRRNAAEVYCEPRSEWKMSPGAGLRWSIAIWRASLTSSARMWSAMAKPTTRLEARSITVAKYSQPSQVRT